jgi:hypothetical protein
MIEVIIPVGKKYRIILNIKDVIAGEGDGIYPPQMYIFCGDKNITDVIIKRNADQVMKPNAHNVKTAIDLIEELEYREVAEKGDKDARS